MIPRSLINFCANLSDFFDFHTSRLIWRATSRGSCQRQARGGPLFWTAGLLGGSLSPKLDNMAVCKHTKKYSSALTPTQCPGERRWTTGYSGRRVFDSGAHFHFREFCLMPTQHELIKDSGDGIKSICNFLSASMF